MAKVLVVDDRPKALKRLAKAAGISGAEVVTAGSAKEALQKIAEEIFDVVVTDLHMETNEAGLEVLKGAKEKDIYTQVIVITAFGPGFNVESMRLGAFDYLEKNNPDIDIDEELKRQVNSALAFRSAKLRERGTQ